MTRRWRHAPLNTHAASGESGFHVQYVVEHPGCASEAQQRNVARRFATAESMWEARRDLWPGEVLADPIPSLGITPGSRAPAGWPPAPPPPLEEKLEVKLDPPPPAVTSLASPVAQGPAGDEGDVTPAPAALPPPPDFGRSSGGGLCAVSEGGAAPAPWALSAFVALLGARARSKRRERPRHR
ncbi:MAG: hypothetical protein KF901_11650 [Myxococcales bacterium]|nr:hypothetical protein [Myxococcales bacterium]